MKKKILLSLLAICIGLISSINILQSHSLTPPVGNTGAPGETTCAQAGCHGGSGTGGVACTDSLIISTRFYGEQYRGTGIPIPFIDYMYDNTKTPNIVDTITITLKLPSAPIAGFQMTATSGSFMIVNANTTQITLSGGKQYVSHKNSTNGSNSWTFKWYPTSSTNPQFYFTTVCDTSSISGGGGGSACAPSCTGSNSSGGGFGGASHSCLPYQLFPQITLLKNNYGISLNPSISINSTLECCVGDTLEFDTAYLAGASIIRYQGLNINVFNSSGVSLFSNTQQLYRYVYVCQVAGSIQVNNSFYYRCYLGNSSYSNSPFINGTFTRITINVHATPSLPKFTALNFCVGKPLTIGYTPSSSNNYVYSWLPTSNLSNSSIPNPMATPSSTTNYYLTATETFNGYVCASKTDTQTIYVHQPSLVSTSTTICKNESYLFNGKPYSSAGIFKDTLVNYVGCDSITTLNLAIKTEEPISINGVVCKGGRFIFNGKMYTTSGIFTDTIFSNTSCDTVYTLTLSAAVIPVDTSVSVGNEMLIAHATNSTFKWYDCVSQSLVPGATNDTLLPPQSGYYAAIITTLPELCSDTSACKFIFTTGINNVDELKQTQLFPNPVHDELKIQFSKTIKSGTIKILDLNGAELMNQSFNNKQFVQFSTKNLVPAIYVVEVQSGNSVWHQKMVKR
ncbi:MAG: hypothetical protein RL708_2569 [Bacteroidota bacterium]|jgi:hypothetical protein